MFIKLSIGPIGPCRLVFSQPSPLVLQVSRGTDNSDKRATIVEYCAVEVID